MKFEKSSEELEENRLLILHVVLPCHHHTRSTVCHIETLQLGTLHTYSRSIFDQVAQLLQGNEDSAKLHTQNICQC
jgi:hypothetical protein